MPTVLDQSQRPPTQYLARAPLFFHFFNEVTPTSWGDPARDFPLFPLVRYPLRRNSAISATPLPPLPRPSRPCAAERTLRRPVDVPGRPRGGPIIFPIFYSSLHNMWSSGPAVALRCRAERRHERTWGRGPGNADESPEMPMPSTSSRPCQVDDCGLLVDGDSLPGRPPAERANRLEIRLQQPRRVVAQAQQQRVVIELGQQEFPAAARYLGQLAGEAFVLDLDSELEVQPETARVPVGTADQRPRVVDRHQLGMVERRGPQPDMAAGFQQGLERHAARPVEHRVVGVLGQHDI